jgi:tetratricopeptide (TPR) repeat protein
MGTKIYIGVLIILSTFLFLTCSNTTDKTKAGLSDSTNNSANIIVNRNDDQKAEGYLEFGDSLVKREDYRGAIMWYTDAIAIKSDYAEAYCSRAFAKYALKDFKGCVKDCDTALAINPHYNEAAYIRSCAKPGAKHQKK